MVELVLALRVDQIVRRRDHIHQIEHPLLIEEQRAERLDTF